MFNQEVDLLEFVLSDLLPQPQYWIKGTYQYPYTEGAGMCFCLTGGIHEAQRRLGYNHAIKNVAIEQLAIQLRINSNCPDLYRHLQPEVEIITYNDDEETTYDDMVKVVQQTITRLQGKEYNPFLAECKECDWQFHHHLDAHASQAAIDHQAQNRGHITHSFRKDN